MILIWLIFFSLSLIIICSLISFIVIFSNLYENSNFNLHKLKNNIRSLLIQIYSTPAVFIGIFFWAFMITRFIKSCLFYLLLINNDLISYIFTIFSLTIPNIIIFYLVYSIILRVHMSNGQVSLYYIVFEELFNMWKINNRGLGLISNTQYLY